jgi:chromodomain-helicase-DNA-binding protein 1
LSPIQSDLTWVIGVTKKNYPDSEDRLQRIKKGLMIIGNHIDSQVREGGFVALEEGMWQYVSERYWPQAKKEETRVSGKKLKDMYTKIKERKSSDVGSARVKGEASNGVKSSTQAPLPTAGAKDAGKETGSSVASKDKAGGADVQMDDAPTGREEVK